MLLKQTPIIFLIFLHLVSLPASSQSVENVIASVENGNKVIITYDLKGNPENERFKVKVYSSHNNYSSPLTRVSGDVSDDYAVKPGNAKQVVWEAQELGSFNGELEFEIRAEVYRMLRVIRPMAGKAVRRGSTTTIEWTGQQNTDKVKIELLKNGAVIATPGMVNNSGFYSWSVPKAIKTGRDYSLRFTTDEGTITSDRFAIRARYPLLLKSAVAIVPVAVAVIILTADGNDDEPLPVPPEPN
jgi:hypothetical protein